MQIGNEPNTIATNNFVLIIKLKHTVAFVQYIVPQITNINTIQTLAKQK